MVTRMDPTTFEQVVAHLLNAQHNIKLKCPYKRRTNSRQFDGYREYWYGIFSHYKIGVECKKWSKRVGVQTVEAFSKKLERCKLNKGIMISFSGFTSVAIDEAEMSNIDIYSFRPLQIGDVAANIRQMDFHEILMPFPKVDFTISADDITPEEVKNLDIQMKVIEDFDIFDEKGAKVGNLDRIAGAMAEFEVLTQRKRVGRITKDWTSQSHYLHTELNGRTLKLKVNLIDVRYKTAIIAKPGVFRHEDHYIMKNEITGARELIPLWQVKKIVTKYKK